MVAHLQRISQGDPLELLLLLEEIDSGALTPSALPEVHDVLGGYLRTLRADGAGSCTTSLLALLALFAWRASLPARAIDDLPEAERRALYHRTLESLDTVCRSHPASLEDFCREQAELAVRFRECDPACHALAEPHLPHSSR